MNANTYTVVTRIGRKVVETKVTRCKNQETGHRVAREVAKTAAPKSVVELKDLSGVTVERFTVLEDGMNVLEVLNGKSVQAVRRAQREAAAAHETAKAKRNSKKAAA